ncbi:hypothetical protein BGV71_15680 [Burkholderia ubonensis]|nr:hypothetical protein WI76_29890 [Burkholderia ubonensis]KVZ32176.1 hypothetical protein WL13_01180 [Burkholderia ubonensis]KWB35264.1 hypothetical protein WL33_19505 [Burkholderia ubonensis]KWC30671.1 hypothetical protein WL50_27000 [Burkholderia ubonensis]OJA80707.1 hypothetical protein BGV71_15680 [Burkholderia ubonensis]
MGAMKIPMEIEKFPGICELIAMYCVYRCAFETQAAQLAGTPITVGADKNYDTAGFVATCRANGVTPHVAQNDVRTGGSAIDRRTTRWPGYAISQRKRKCIEQVFGWSKTVGRIRQVMYRGRERVEQFFLLTQAAYNLTRMRTLAAKAA